MEESFVVYLSFLPTLGVLAFIIFAVAAIIEGKSTMKKSLVIRSVYFYLASLVTLAIVVGSLIFLFNLGLKSWVFTEADPLLYRVGSPPALFSPGRLGPESTGQEVLTCEESCELSASQKSSIARWQDNYTSWQERKSNPGAERARDAVSALSFLIIALPFFLIHFRIVQKDAKKEDVMVGRDVIRPTYFYFISLVSLLMIVIAGGMLINLALKTWVIPNAGEADKMATKVMSAEPYMVSGETSVQSIADCGEKCGLDNETVVLANQWLDDYDQWQDTSRRRDNTQGQAASTIPFVLLGIPLFWYHWSVVRKESKEKKNKQEEANIS